jgi:hypothetical protein
VQGLAVWQDFRDEDLEDGHRGSGQDALTTVVLLNGMVFNLIASLWVVTTQVRASLTTSEISSVKEDSLLPQEIRGFIALMTKYEEAESTFTYHHTCLLSSQAQITSRHGCQANSLHQQVQSHQVQYHQLTCQRNCLLNVVKGTRASGREPKSTT